MISAPPVNSILSVLSDTYIVIDQEEQHATIARVDNSVPEEILSVICLSDHKLFIEEYDRVVEWKLVDTAFVLDKSVSTQDGVNKLVSKLMLDLFIKFKDDYNNLDFVTQLELSREVVRIKENLVEKMTNWFDTNPDKILSPSDMESILSSIRK